MMFSGWWYPTIFGVMIFLDAAHDSLRRRCWTICLETSVLMMVGGNSPVAHGVGCDVLMIRDMCPYISLYYMDLMML